MVFRRQKCARWAYDHHFPCFVALQEESEVWNGFRIACREDFRALIPGIRGMGNSRRGSKLIFFAWFLFQKVPHYVKKVHLKLMAVLLSQPPEHWCSRQAASGLALFSILPHLFFFPCALKPDAFMGQGAILFSQTLRAKFLCILLELRAEVPLVMG